MIFKIPKDMNKLLIVLIIIGCCNITNALNVTETYVAGDISTHYLVYEKTCNGPITTISFPIPSGEKYIVSSIDVTYNMTATSPAYISDQRSQIYCVNTGLFENAPIISTNSAGPYTYSLSNLDIANGVYSEMADIEFEMRAWRTFGVTPACGDTYNKVDDGTWSITLTYELNDCPDPSGISTTFKIENQTAIDDFASNYPNCYCLGTGLLIGKSNQTDIDDLSGLDQLVEIDGILIINNTDLTVETNVFPSLISIESSLQFGTNNSLTQIDGFKKLLEIGGNFVFNDQIQIISGFDKLKHVGNDLIIKSPNISSFPSFSALLHIERRLEIDLEQNTVLPNITAFNNLKTVGSLKFRTWTQTDFNGFSTLKEINGFLIIHAPWIMSFPPFPLLKKILGNVTLSQNSLTTTFTCLNAVDTIGGDLTIKLNNNLTNLNSFSKLEMIGGKLKISENNILTTFSNFDSLKVVVEAIEIIENPNLMSFSVFPSLLEANNITVKNCPSIVNLNSFLSYEIANWDLNIIENSGLTSLGGLENIEEYTGDFNIIGNQNLTNIDSLKNIEFISGRLTVKDNSQLSSCCLLDVLHSDVVSSLSVGNNAEGCNSFRAIRDSCSLFDPDQDGLINSLDNCPNHYNPKQEDQDGDNIGNACDNCPLLANTPQLDTNNNFIGDACEIAEPGKAGVNTTSPKSGLEISASELYLSDTQRGLIMTNPLGECFRLHIDLEGNLQSKKIDCPN